MEQVQPTHNQPEFTVSEISNELKRTVEDSRAVERGITDYKVSKEIICRYGHCITL